MIAVSKGSLMSIAAPRGKGGCGGEKVVVLVHASVDHYEAVASRNWPDFSDGYDFIFGFAIIIYATR